MCALDPVVRAMLCALLGLKRNQLVARIPSPARELGVQVEKAELVGFFWDNLRECGRVERIIKNSDMGDKENHNRFGRKDQMGIIQNRYDDNEVILEETTLTETIKVTDPKRRRTNEPNGEKPIFQTEGDEQMDYLKNTKMD
ncbi:hypothetical protein AgCh_023768 [Apium graveolens]